MLLAKFLLGTVLPQGVATLASLVCVSSQQNMKWYVLTAYLHCTLSLAVQCIVIGPVCRGRAGGVCLWVCYHDNSKLCALILTKLGL